MKHNLTLKKQDFFEFSEKFWKLADMEETCLCLHEKYHINENFLAVCCWLPLVGFRRLTENDIRYVLRRVEPWRERILLPLIRLTQQIGQRDHKQKLSNISGYIKKEIIHAQKIESSLIIDVLNKLPKENDDTPVNNVDYALVNVFSYIHYLGVKPHKNDLEKIYRVTQATGKLF